MIAANDEFLSPKIDEPRLFTIEQVSAQTGLTKRTLRYYEEVGLLPPTDRTEGNYRRYTEADVKRLDKIKKLRDLLGFFVWIASYSGNVVLWRGELYRLSEGGKMVKVN